MKTVTENCYKKCLPQSLMSQQLTREVMMILAQLQTNSKIGRPSLDKERMLNGIFYVLKTGIQWKALPRCFGSSSAVHRFFQKLVRLGFFKRLWSYELEQYNSLHQLDLSVQAMDCAHRKSPLGNDFVGISPVDRRKHGTKLSVLSDKKGIILGIAIGPSNQHDSKLFLDTIKSTPTCIKQPYYKEMHLDSAYDSEEIKTILFNYYYIPKIAPNQRRSKVKPPNPVGYTRWFIEPVHSWLNRFRAIMVRYTKLAENYLSLAQFAASIIIFNKI